MGIAADEHRRSAARRALIIASTALLGLVLLVLNVLAGSSGMSAGTVARAIFAPSSAEVRARAIVWTMRMPSAIMSLLAGASLGLAGGIMQTILDNPLASPYTLGVSAGAGFGAALSMIFGFGAAGTLSVAMTPICAFVFALLSCIGIYTISARGGFSSSVMVLAGIGMVFFFQALQSIMQFIASPEVLQSIVYWVFGSLQRASWANIPVLASVLAAASIYIGRQTRGLTAMRLGDTKAASLGVDVRSLRRGMLAAVSLITAATVAFVGTIGFIGIVGPHIARLFVGEDQRWFLPMSALSGAAILSVASLMSRTLIPGTIIPIGILTALVGVPFFFVLVWKSHAER